MDPKKNGILQRILTSVIYGILTVCYWIMRIVLNKRMAQEKILPDPKHLIPSPDVPIPSLDLALALNPKTDLNRLVSYARSNNVYIRRAVMRNPSLPTSEILRVLKEDPEQMVVMEAERVLRDRQAFDPHAYELPAI